MSTLKAQITTEELAHKEFPSGEPCWLTRISLEPKPVEGGRIFTTFTYTSQKEEYQSLILGAGDQPVLDENEELTYETKIKTIISKTPIHKSEKTFTHAEINDLTAQMEQDLPANLNAVDRDTYLRALALKYVTINVEDLPNGFMGTKLWSLDLQS